MDAHWSMIWHQAMTQSFQEGKAFGWNKTAVFHIKAPAAGTQIRMKFSNRFGSVPYEFGSVAAFAGGQTCPITLRGQRSFSIAPGGLTTSDPAPLTVQRGEEIQIRLFYTNAILDSNMIEAEANLLKGDRTGQRGNEKFRTPLLAKILGAYNAIPSLEGVEIETEEPTQAIVAFGDSIVAQNRWTKALAVRLDQAYPGEYALLNSGISGNCLLYEPEGVFGSVFGEMGIKRFRRDVLEIPNLKGMIFGLGVNDVAYLSEKTVQQITLDAFRNEVTVMVEQLHRLGVRVVMQTITPRLGVIRKYGKYDRNMENLRLQYNDWIRHADLFDYVFDAEAVVREERPDGYYYGEGLHLNDHLHPNMAGAQKLADAFDLEKLTGKA